MRTRYRVNTQLIAWIISLLRNLATLRHCVAQAKLSIADTIAMNVTPSHFALLRKSLDVLATKHQVISHNMANLNTPGYKTREVGFDEELIRSLGNEGADRESIDTQITESVGLVSRMDGNNVDIDREIGKLNRNTLMFQTFSQLLTSQFQMLRSSITGQ